MAEGVIVSSPLGLNEYHADVIGWLKNYASATGGVKALDGPTVILGPSAEPRSQVFPGLWLDGAALGAREYAGVIGTLKRGLASPGHAEFVELLESRASRD